MEINSTIKMQFILLLGSIYLSVVTLCDTDCIVYANFIIWLVGSLLIPINIFVTLFYWFVFGVFFVLPVIMLGGVEYLVQGAFLKSLSLSEDQALLIVQLIFTYLVAFLGSVIIFAKKAKVSVSDKPNMVNKEIYYLLLVVLFCIVVGFNIIEIDAVYSEGYAAVQKGELSVKKGLVVLVAEVFLLTLLSLGLSTKNFFSFILLQLYAFSLVFTGIRMPGVTLAFFSFLYYFPHWRKRAFAIVILAIVVAPPLLMFTQALRMYGYSAFEYFSFWYGYYDLINVLGFTVDTLKAAVDIEDGAVSISPIYKPILIWSIFSERVLGHEFALTLGSFGPEVTKYYSSELYESLGTTVSSSSIAEAWYFMGWLGVAVLGIVTFSISKSLSTLAWKESFYSALLYLIVVPRFIMAIRNEMFGWFFESLIWLFMCLPFFVISYYFFYKTPVQKRV